MRARRAVSPVVGVALMVAITVVLAAAVVLAVPALDDVATPSFADDEGTGADEPGAGSVQTQLVREADGDAGETDDHYVRVHVEAGSNADGSSLNSLTVA